MSVETVAVDRLPWLPDEPALARPARPRRSGWQAWAMVAVLAVAGFGSWLGYQNVAPAPERSTPLSTPVAKVQLPAARPAVPEVSLPQQREVAAPSVPEVRPVVQHDVRIAPPPSKPRSAVPQTKPAAQALVAAPVIARPVPRVGPWEPRVTSGAAGRLVQIGAFGSVPQAKRGWRYMVRAYPALSRLPAVVRPARNSKGRVFYRFRIGTTSQAHSEILCQRMQRIDLSCAVVGLPWKAKVER